MTRARFALLLACLAAAPILAAVPGNAGEPVNVATASLRNASGALYVGRDIGAGQTIATEDGERLDLLFPDGSSLTLAPNAQAMIEAFSYDRRQGTGHLVMRLTSGLYRFTAGRLAKQSMATVDTPAATLSIHDGIVLIRVEPERTTTIATSGVGVTVTTSQGSQVLRRPGWQVVAEAGSPPSLPTAVSGNVLSMAVAEFDPRPATSGVQAGAGVTTDTNKAAVNALSDANTLLQKSPAGGTSQSVRNRGP